MGGHPYAYYVDYQPDIDKALQELREREFKAGRYFPAMLYPGLEPNASPGAQHESIDDAINAAEANGTRSILDLSFISDEPEYGAVTPLSTETLIEQFGTDKPTREMIDNYESDDDDLMAQIERGQGIYIIVYQNNEPKEIFFFGYSFD